MAKPVGTVLKHHELSRARQFRDTRTPGAKMLTWLKSAEGASFTMIGCAGFGFVIPGLMETMTTLAMIALMLHKYSKHKLPFRMPIHSKLPDYSNINPDSKKPEIAEGIFYLGNQMDDLQELWFDKKDICTHILMLATTGSGKTEAILSIAMNALAQGSGFAMVDGKADVSLLGKIYFMCKMMGREDDLLVLNYNTGNMDVGFDTPDQKISNTLNPFTFGSSSSLTQLLVSLMSDSGGKGDFWKDRAISLVESIIPALVWMRDKRGLLLDVSVIRDYLNLARIVELRKISAMPINIQESLRSYCENLAGWSERKGAAQGDTTMEQHGYLQMQFTRTLGSLGDVYGHIFRTPLGEIDMYDVVTNRRILLVMLPALEKSPAELANLGKILVALLKGMMASALGNRFEGDSYEVLDDRFTTSDTPFQVLFDEYGAYSVDGAQVMPAQARSLNIQMLFASQDYAGFKRSNEDSAISIIGNCNIKIFGKIEDGDGTFGVYKQQVGDAYVTNVRGYDTNKTFMGGYSANSEASIEQVSRANLQDLKNLTEGEMMVLFKSNIVPTYLFYANPTRGPKIRINEFIRVRPPSEELLASIDESMSNLIERLQSTEFAADLPAPATSRDLDFIFDATKRNAHLSMLEKSAATIAMYHIENIDSTSATFAEPIDPVISDQEFDESFDGAPGQSNIFTKPPEFENEEMDLGAFTRQRIQSEKSATEKLMEATLGDEYVEDAQRSISDLVGLNPHDLKQNLSQLEVMTGSTEAQAADHADNIMEEMQSITDYPKTTADPMPAEELVEAMELLEEFLAEEPNGGQN